jgi:hypothetical protein
MDVGPLTVALFTGLRVDQRAWSLTLEIRESKDEFDPMVFIAIRPEPETVACVKGVAKLMTHLPKNKYGKSYPDG